MEAEPLIESSFRRLLAAIEHERDGLRTSWRELKAEQKLQKEKVNLKEIGDFQTCIRIPEIR